MISQNEKDLLKLTEYYKAMSDPVRITLLRLLSSAGGEEMKSTELVRLSGFPISSVNRHLKILRESGILMFRSEDRTLFYSIDLLAVQEFSKLTDDLCRELGRG